MSQRIRMFAASTFLIAASWAGPAAAEEGPEISLEDSRKMFAANCSWCHGNFGMKAGKGGPKLAGTPKDEEQVYQTIMKGRGAMPSFKATLTEEKIRALAKYIKSLPGDEQAQQ